MFRGHMVSAQASDSRNASQFVRRTSGVKSRGTKLLLIFVSLLGFDLNDGSLFVQAAFYIIFRRSNLQGFLLCLPISPTKNINFNGNNTAFIFITYYIIYCFWI